MISSIYVVVLLTIFGAPTQWEAQGIPAEGVTCREVVRYYRDMINPREGYHFESATCVEQHDDQNQTGN